jgi:methionine synthase I (cobalamin-dependent)/5,10-methylenetetrahydrofolate reductase
MAALSFRERLAKGVVLADGAMGTLLHAKGVPIDSCFDELNLSNPALVAEVHRGYLEAGTEIVETNTFGANRYKLAGHGLSDQMGAINAAGVELARRVVEASFKDNVYIAASVGPLGVRLAPVGRVRPAEALAAFREQIAALVAAGADLLILETFSDLAEIGEAVRAARDVSPDIPIVAEVTFTRDDRTLLGDGPTRAAHALAEMGVDVIGANCSGGPAQILRIVEQMRAAAPDVPLSAVPNAGWPEQVGGRTMYPASPDYFGEYALALTRAGVSLVGGCCGTTPKHIAAMRRALDNPEAYTTPAFGVTVRRVTAAEVASPEGPTVLARKLAGDEFLIAVEMSPPKGIAPDKVIAGARTLVEAGADFIDVADSPMARMRMSPWAVAYLIQREVGVETVLHFPTRGRNLLRVQGDLLAAHALGVRNLFIVMGDPTNIGDYPDAADNYDVTPSGLVRLVKRSLNVGQDQAGNAIGQPASFVAGCALNMSASDLARETRILRKKVEAGADFALTQPVYDPEVARRFFAAYAESYGPLDLPVLVGVLPLFSARHARFLHNEVPGINIPEGIMGRIETGDDVQAFGLRIACQIVDELRSIKGVRGVYLMPAFGRYDLAAEVIDCVRAKAGV